MPSEDTQFKEGNQFWKRIDPSKIGRNLNFETPSILWDKACGYFKECDENPLSKTETSTTDKGVFYKTTSFKVPYTWEGLYVYLEVTTLDQYKERPAFLGIIKHIGNIIRNQKYSGAAAGLFNANIIAKDLGLTDRIDHTTKGESIAPQPIPTINIQGIETDCSTEEDS